jgi:proteasome lid subunit RPN8/RPN11
MENKMTIIIPPEQLALIYANGEKAYPDEGAGFLFGKDGEIRQVVSIFDLPNTREEAARHDRFLVSPEDYLKGELKAEELNLDIIGIFHSHPDDLNKPSAYDLEWAQPFFSYVITSVYKGKASASRSWRMLDDRSQFIEEPIESN